MYNKLAIIVTKFFINNNYVKEDGYPYATLGYTLVAEMQYYKIFWSPDSV